MMPKSLSKVSVITRNSCLKGLGLHMQGRRVTPGLFHAAYYHKNQKYASRNGSRLSPLSFSWKERNERNREGGGGKRTYYMRRTEGEMKCTYIRTQHGSHLGYPTLKMSSQMLTYILAHKKIICINSGMIYMYEDINTSW